MVATPSSVRAEESVDFVDQLLKLPDEEKSDLAYLLLDSIRKHYSSFAEAEERDRVELNRRLDDYVSGRVKAIPGAEVLADLRARLAEYRALRAKI